MTTLRAAVPTALAALLAAALPAAAAEQPLWELGLGAGALHLPHYRGADQSHTWLLPVPYVVYRGRIFKADREGARAVLFESDRIDFDLSLAASAPTRSEDNDARRGMADLEPTIELGPKLNVVLGRGSGWKLDLRLPVRAALTVQSKPQGIGWTAAPVLNLDLPRNGWNLGLQAGPVYGSRRFNGYFYDVLPAEALPDRPAYRARAGYAGAQATVALSKRFDRVWLGLFARADSLRGAVFEDSPLVRRTSNVSAGIALSYVFAQSADLVATDD